MKNLVLLGNKNIPVDLDILDHITKAKEEFSQVSSEFEDELKRADQGKINREVKLPDNLSVTIKSERFRVPEALFKPNLIQKDDPGIHEQLNTAISNVEKELFREM